MGYEVHQFENAAGDVWYQVGRRRWLFWMRWDAEWPWDSAVRFGSPTRHETIDEAYARLDELVLNDKVNAVRSLGPVGRPSPADIVVDEIASFDGGVSYAVALLPQERQTVTETSQKQKKRRTRKKS